MKRKKYTESDRFLNIDTAVSSRNYSLFFDIGRYTISFYRYSEKPIFKPSKKPLNPASSLPSLTPTWKKSNVIAVDFRRRQVKI